jgi:hypothetical protein
MERTTRRRRAISTALAVVLALESVTVVAAAARTSTSPQTGHALSDASPAWVVPSGPTTGEPDPGRWVEPANVPPAANVPVAIERAAAADEVPAIPVAVVPAAGAISPPAASLTGREGMPERPAGRTASSSTAGAAAAPTGSATYTGRNHLWIPALRISRSVSSYQCSRTSALDNLVYRWGCGGTNNLYLMGHAYSVFKPLHDAYVAGRLAVGMKAWYADSRGRVHVYAVRWWKRTRPIGASWAYAAQDKPSMTLQTCLGADSQYRLVVRLIEVDG